MMKEDVALGETVYFWFALNNTSGSGADGTTPLFDVRKAGDSASAIPILSGTPTLLTHANYPDGCYEVSIAATTGNGFVTGGQYGVFCTASVSSQNPTGYVGGFTVDKLLRGADNSLLLRTTIATVNSQTDFALTTGSDANDQYNELLMTVEDVSNPPRIFQTYVDDYIAASFRVLPKTAPTFTAVAGDIVRIYARPHRDSRTDGFKKNVAFSNFQFHMRSSTDHVTGVTGIVPTCQRAIDSGSYAACANSPSEVGNGLYRITLATTDLNGDIVTFRFTGTGADPTIITVKTNL